MNGKRFISSAAVALAAIFLGAISALSQSNYCVGPSATGNGTGSDWNNVKAWGRSPARGDTWYLMNGSYASQTFSTALSGTNLITIEKATASDHVTATGWTATMANQATFTGAIYFQSGYWVFDGQVRNENNWYDGTAYGFLINSQDFGVRIAQNTAPSPCEYITVRYVHADFPGNNGNEQIGVYTDNGNDSGTHNRGIVVSHCGFNQPNVSISLRGTVGALAEYNACENNWGSTTYHGDVINVYYCDQGGGTIRYNKLRNNYVAGNGTGGVTCYYTGSTSGMTEIYGNTFYHQYGGDGCVAEYNPTGQNNNILVYNNTMVDSEVGGVEVSAAGGGGWTGNVAYNNLIIGGSYRMSCNTDDYNAWSPGGISEANGEYDIDHSIFVNYTNQDFRLARNTSPGIALSFPYSVDMLGNPRTTRSRGAYEFIAVTPPMIAVSAPLLAFGSVRTNTTRDLALTVQNRAGGTLAGTATAAVPFSIISGSAYSLAAGQSQSVAVRYSPVSAGSNWQTIWFTGGGGATVTASGAGGQ